MFELWSHTPEVYAKKKVEIFISPKVVRRRDFQVTYVCNGLLVELAVYVFYQSPFNKKSRVLEFVILGCAGAKN